MTLGERQIERWARQIILPEVGGRGQTRLLAATAGIAGTGRAARFAEDLLSRAGVRTDGRVRADLLLDFSTDATTIRARGRAARDARRPFIVALPGRDCTEVATLVGGPCIDCAELPPAAGEPDAPTAMALGALAAGEALRVLLVPSLLGRVQTLDLRTGRLAARDLDGPRCAACGTAAS